MEKFGNVVTKDEDGKIMFDFGVNKRKFRRPRYTEEERQTRRAQFAQDAKNLKESRRHQLVKDFGKNDEGKEIKKDFLKRRA